MATSAQLDSLRTAADRLGVDIPELVLPDDHQVILGRLRFHFLDWGTTGQPPIVFLHGFGLTAHSWDLVALALRRDHHCFALDQRGHGDSEWSPELEYNTTAYAGDAGALIEQLELHRPLLVGMSMGGLAGMRFASDHGDRVSGLVMVDAGLNPRQAGTSRMRSFMAQEDERDSVEDFVQQALEFNPRRDADTLRVSLLHNLRQLSDGKWTWKYDRRHFSRITPESASVTFADLRARAPRVGCATLIVRGEHSDLFTATDLQDLAGLIPDARAVTVPDAGHNVQGDNPAGLVSVLREFVAGLS
jgi:pimeloyl-ACP methyl ester carboxylesterase